MALYVNIPATGSSWTSVPVLTNKQDVDITVDGETAWSIEVYAVAVNNNASVSTYSVQPNTLTTNQLYWDVEGIDGGVPETSVFAAAEMDVGFAGVSGGYCVMKFQFFMKTGTLRSIIGTWSQYTNVPAFAGISSYQTIWTDTTTAITSVRLHSNRTDGWKAGSLVTYRIGPLAG